MGKSIRSKSARKFRAIKRETIFGPVEDARVQRLAERLKKDAEGPKTSELEALAKGEEPMQVEKGKGWSMTGGIHCLHSTHWLALLKDQKPQLASNTLLTFPTPLYLVAEDAEMTEKISTSGRKESSSSKNKLARMEKKKNSGKVSKRTQKKSSTFFRFHK
jgi:hypothetical protein